MASPRAIEGKFVAACGALVYRGHNNPNIWREAAGKDSLHSGNCGGFGEAVGVRASRVTSAFLALLLVALLLGRSATAAESTVPRFSALRFDRVNLRVGPGANFPIEWVLTRRNMPVEVIAEYESWRRVRDWQGTEGWLRENSLTGRRTALVLGSVRLLYRAAGDLSQAVAQVEPGAIGQLLGCEGEWCRLDFAGKRGYLKRGEFWGAYPNETVK